MSRPALLLLVERSDSGLLQPEGLATALQPARTEAEVFQIGRRSAFTSAKRDEHGREIALAPLGADLLVEAQYPSLNARDRALTLTGRRLHEIGGLSYRFVPGQVHDLIPGGGAVTVAFFAARRTELTRRRFQDYWLNDHALIAEQVPGGPSYRQLHVLANEPNHPGRSDPAQLEATRWDGITTMRYASYEALAATRVSPTVAVTAFLDEQTFIDHSRSSMAFFDACDF